MSSSWKQIQQAVGTKADGMPGINTAKAIITKYAPNAEIEGKSQSELWSMVSSAVGQSQPEPTEALAKVILEVVANEGSRRDWMKVQYAAGVAPTDGRPGTLTAQGILSKWLPNAEPAITTKDVWKQVQTALGVTADGIPGKNTVSAIIAKWIEGPHEEAGDKVEGSAGTDEDFIEDPEVFADLYPDDAADARVHRICNEVLRVFETGSRKGDYSKVTIYADGPGNTKQITYGAAQTTESGNLKTLLTRYIETGANTAAAKIIKTRLPKVGNRPYLVNDQTFIQALKDAGKEELMQKTQDKFFDGVYWNPAYKWFHNNGFTLPLSMLVIFDSFIHSGSILSFLRNRFKEGVPANGGSEKTWISEYVRVRRSWLANHSNTILRKTTYRMDTMQRAISADNWNLTAPLNANGVIVS